MRHPLSLVRIWPQHFPAQVVLPTPRPKEESVRPFGRMYDEVTDELRAYCVRVAIPLNELQFIEYLISAFYAEFLKWTSEWRPRSYVRFFCRKTSFTLFRLFAHAYLHIVWDLTRCVANALQPGGVAVPRGRAIEVFANANATFYDVLQRCSRDRSTVGWFAQLANLAGKRRRLLDIGGHWIVALRMSALAYAQVLADATQPERRKKERLLWAGIEKCVEKVSDERLNPVYWFTVFRYPALLAVIPLTVALQLDSTLPSALLTSEQFPFVILAVASLVVGYFVLAYVGLVRAISSLGRDLDEMLQRLIDDEPERPSSSKQL